MKSLPTSLFISLLITSPCAIEAQPSSIDFDIQMLADGIYAAIHKPGGRAICNAGIIDLGEATMVIDPFISPYAAEELKRVIAEMGLPSVRYVVNTHFHNDHIRGNQVFSGAAIYSTKKTRDMIAAYEPEEIEYERKVLPSRISTSDSTLAALPSVDTAQRRQLEFWNNYFKTIRESHSILTTVLPNKMVEGEENIKGIKHSVKLMDMGKGHTESDLIVVIPQQNIIFTGDLLFIENHPWIADGQPDSLKNILLEIKAMNPTILVPGHGPAGSIKDIDTFIAYLNHIHQAALEMITKMIKPEQLTDAFMPVTYETWLLARFYLPNIKFRMEQLLAQTKQYSE